MAGIEVCVCTTLRMKLAKVVWHCAWAVCMRVEIRLSPAIAAVGVHCIVRVGRIGHSVLILKCIVVVVTDASLIGRWSIPDIAAKR